MRRAVTLAFLFALGAYLGSLICDDAFSSTTDENAMQFIKQGPNELPQAAALFGLLAHNSEMYGVGTVYLRLKGIVPPATERANARRSSGR